MIHQQDLTYENELMKNSQAQETSQMLPNRHRLAR
jgi:hypothetical protein